MLSGFTSGNALIPAFASSNIEIYPYQIAAAQFALRSPYLHGVICGDECSLGKTYVALLAATQKWYEGKDKLLLVLPVNMVGQWVKKIEASFSIPYVLMDTKEAFDNAGIDNPFIQDGLVITTYEFAVSKAEYIKQIKWDMVIFDEADRLNKAYTGENKTANALKAATYGVFKMLLTPTPIEMDIRDIYGLIYFIDETVLPMNVDEFYKRYFRRPDRYSELAEWVSRFCFRTLKSQVTSYVNFTERIPYTIGCEFTVEERRLYDKLQEYIAWPEKIAYPDIDLRDMGLQHNHILSSSTHAYIETVDGAIKGMMKMPAVESKLDLYRKELQALREIKALAEAVDINGKTKMLFTLLKQCFSRLRQLRIQQKAVVFVDNLTTIKYLSALLTERGYSNLTYSGNNSRDYDLMERFRNDKSIQILIATGGVTKGLDIEFCPLVINYDLLSNALEMEHRISRCHRQGQQADVLVINLFSIGNDADMRYLELINKRTLQFDGIFGLSDTVLGNFDANTVEILSRLRLADEIQTTFERNLSEHEPENREIVKDSLDSLFTTFTKEIADKVTVTPQYIEAESKRLNSSLWEVVRWFFNEYNHKHDDCRYDIDEQAQTIAARDYSALPQLFYYFTGSRNKPYTSLKGYGMAQDYKPHHGRITLVSPIGKGIVEALECSDEGTLTVDVDIEPCTVGLYCVEIRTKGSLSSYGTLMETHYIFTGKTASGRVLSDEDCINIMELTVAGFTDGERNSASWLKGTGARYNELDSLVPQDELLKRSMEQANPAMTEEIDRMKRRRLRQKAEFEHALDDMRTQVETLRRELDNAQSAGIHGVERAKIQRRFKLAQSELRKREENLLMDCLQADEELARQVKEFIDKQQLTAKTTRHFILQVSGSVSSTFSDEEIEQLLDEQTPAISVPAKSVIASVISKAFDAASDESDNITNAVTIDAEAFSKATYTETITEEKVVTYEEAAEIMTHLEKKDYITKSGKIKDSMKKAVQEGTLDLPARYEAVKKRFEEIINKADRKPPIRDASRDVIVRLKKQVVEHDPQFKAIWDRIAQKTTYRVQVDNAELIRRAVKALKEMPALPKARIVFQSADLDIQNMGITHRERGLTTQDVQSHYSLLPDLMAIACEETRTPRKIIFEIIKESGRVSEFVNNPQMFIENFIEIIKDNRHALAIDGIKYVKLGGEKYYALATFDAKELLANLDKNAVEVKNSVYDYIIYDSETVEKPFAKALDDDPEVKMFFKLPPRFKIDTPIGTYNPDWAVFVERDGAEKLYFVIETKGNTGMLELRTKELLKIHCGKQHFKALESDVELREATNWKSVKVRI